MKVSLTDGVLEHLTEVHRNLTPAELYEHAVRNGEGQVAADGPIVTETGQYTGRSPKDKYVVSYPNTKDSIWWAEAAPMEPEAFERLRLRQAAYLQGRRVYVRDCYAGADPAHRLAVRVVNQHAWHNLFVHNMFLREGAGDRLEDFEPGFTIVHTPDMKADPAIDGTRSEAFVALDFTRKLVLIGGTSYAGEMKKSIFTVLNYLLPAKGVLGMHCSANVGKDGDVALFFGLSGTGKTTLSADSERPLIGDDEHGWSDDGVFNFEGGCYAKVIKLNREAEPEIYATTERFGTVLENVRFHEGTRSLNLDDNTLTENTRASYPIHFIPNVVEGSRAGAPNHLVMLTCDAFGVLPPISKLSKEQAMYHFLSGYTAKVAGTERGVTEPKATFSACFGAPFMARPPAIYAELLGKKVEQHDVDCWLINTGWSGGPYGTGSRMKIQYSRAMIHAALSGALDGVEFTTHPILGLDVPTSCPGVPAEVLDPRSTWSDGAAYDAKAKELAGLFSANFETFASTVSQAVRDAGPKG